MGVEYPPEMVWRAQDLYCIDRLSFDKVAAEIGVAASTLKRWAENFGWQAMRESIAKAQAEIRANKVLARAKTINALMNNPRADMAFAVSALEGLALKEAEAARVAEERAEEREAAKKETISAETITTPQDAISALHKGVDSRLRALLRQPEKIDLKKIQEVQKCFALLSEMQAALPTNAEENTAVKGLSASMHERLVAVLSGKVEI